MDLTMQGDRIAVEFQHQYKVMHFGGKKKPTTTRKKLQVVGIIEKKENNRRGLYS